MQRDQLTRMLARLVEEGEITEAEAAEILRAFDAGAITAEDLPLTGEDASPTLTDALLVAILLALARKIRAGESVTALTDALLRLSVRERTAVFEELRDEAQAEMRRAARRYAEGGSLRAFHEEMRDAITRFAVESSVVARQGALSAAERGALQAQLDEQMAYLRRYAEQAAVRAVEATEARPFTPGELTSRSELYAALGIAAFWLGIAALRSGEEGYVAYYISMDDGGTCGPCLNADLSGPYLPENVPAPGLTCVAGGRCRCVVDVRYNPSQYARLI